MHCAGVADNSVGNTILKIAGGDSGFAEERKFGGGEGWGVGGMRGEPAFDEVGIEEYAIVAWIAGNDAVEIHGIPLRFAQGLLSAGGASDEVSISSGLCVEGADELLCALREHMRTPVGPVANSLGVPDAEVEAIALVAGIRTSDSVPGDEGLTHLVIGKGAGVASVPGGEKLVIPGGRIGEPEFHGDGAIGTGGGGDADVAVSWQGEGCGRKGAHGRRLKGPAGRYSALSTFEDAS